MNPLVSRCPTVLYQLVLILALSMAVRSPAQTPGTPIEPRSFSPANPALRAALELLRSQGKLWSIEQVNAALANPTPAPVTLPAPSDEPLSTPQIAEIARKSLVRVGWYYLCTKCDNWHVNLSDGYALNKSGVIATCQHELAHVSLKMREGYLFVLDADGTPKPVTAILAAEKSMDTALILAPLEVARPVPLTEEVSPGHPTFLLCDPGAAPGFFSTGVVSRFFWDSDQAGDLDTLDGVRRLRLNVSNDWAPGGSGAAILDRFGNAIGHVSEISAQFEPRDSSTPTTTASTDRPRATYLVLHKAVPARVVRMLAASMDDGAAAVKPAPGAVVIGKVTPRVAQPTTQQANSVTLSVGDPAPALAVSKWLKGTPIEKFEPGQVYVVEFWATWCGPCKAAMPHLSELAGKHAGKITFVGVSVWEHFEPEELIDQLTRFVAAQGDKMAYNVAADSAGAMARTWLGAAGQNGIPCSMVVGADGRLAWIGHPTKLDAVLDSILAGTFSVDQTAQEMKVQQSSAAQLQSLAQAVREARDTRDPKQVVAAIDALIASVPTAELQYAEAKFDSLDKLDPARATTYLTDLAHGDRLIKPMQQVSTSVVSRLTSLAIASGDPDRLAPVLIMLAHTEEATQSQNPGIVSWHAEALAKVGQFDRAIEKKKQAIALCEATIARGDPPGAADAARMHLVRYQTELDAIIKTAASAPKPAP